MEQNNATDIKILISCHKEIVLPRSEVYLPVQVGAANTDKRIAGMQPDNVGENISDRNFTFCELTAQYWAWKNLAADYIGLCHYRRFFCFDGQKRTTNDHMQTEVDALSEYSIRDLGLDDTALIRENIEGADIIAAPLWDVSKTVAPGGVKNTVAEHMIAYGLFEKGDLDTLREIVAKRQPIFLPYFDSYVNGKKYRGYSCYVMRKDLFDLFCEFEFDVLLAFDSQFDYSNLTGTRRRICGFLGEILYSVFVEYAQAELGAQVKLEPLVFFSETTPDPFKQAQNGDASKSCDCERDEIENAAPENNEPKRINLEIVWRYRDFSTSALLAGIQSLVDTIDPAKRYRLTILHEDNLIYSNLEIALPKIPNNLVIDHAHWTCVPLLAELPDLSVDDLEVLEALLLPWLNPVDHPQLWIDGLVAFSHDPAKMLESLDGGACAKGLKNIVLQRELNKPQKHRIAEAYGLSTRGDCFADTTVLLLDSAWMRDSFNPERIYKAFESLKETCAIIPSEKPLYGEPRKREFKLPFYCLENQAFRARLMDALDIETMQFADASTTTHYPETIDWANADVAQEWKSARCPILTYCEYGRVPLMDDNYFLNWNYWTPARHMNVYEMLLSEVFAPRTGSAIKRMLPAGTRRGQMARVLFKKIKG